MENKERKDMNAEGRKEGARWCGKFFIANLFAFSLFSCVGYFYCYGIRVPDGRLCRCVEGRTLLRLDANALNNAYYNDFGRDLTNVDVLILGSSHIEAYQVLKNENIGYLLNLRFANDKEACAFYSCGISGYFLSAILSQYEATLEKFAPRKYVVIELREIPTVGAIEQGLDKFLPYSDKRRSFIRLLWGGSGCIWGHYKITKICRKRGTGKVEQSLPEEQKEAWERLVKRIVKISIENNVRPIFLYHQRAKIGPNGEYLPAWNVDDLAAFRAICEREGVVFVDATERFREEYEKNNVWPYGFCNAGIISGHLNRDGHRMVADVLEEAIRKLEAEKEAETTSATQNSEAVKTVVEAGEESEAKQ